MSARVKAKIGSTVVEVEGAGIKDVIQALSPYYDVFSEKECGKCGSQELGVNHRKAKTFDFYSLKCLSCGYRLDFGQHQEGGTLFPKRKDKDKNPIENNGWVHWQDRQEDQAQPSYDQPPQAQNTYDPNDF